MTTRIFKRTNRKLKKAESVQGALFIEAPARAAPVFHAAAPVPAFAGSQSATLKEVLFPAGEPPAVLEFREAVYVQAAPGSLHADAISDAAEAVRTAIAHNPRRLQYSEDESDRSYFFWHAVSDLPAAVMQLESKLDAKSAAIIHAVTLRAGFTTLRRPVTATGIASICSILEQFVSNSRHLFATQSTVFE